LVILAFVVITTVDAQSDEKKDKKAKTEAVKDCSKCPSAAECGMAAGEAPVPGSQAKHSCANCDPAKCKDGKCDSACKANCAKNGSDEGCTPSKCHAGSVQK
ncbi:MAG: hypothetical protein R6W81_02545, partial [Bacteroidales bacterium]